MTRGAARSLPRRLVRPLLVAAFWLGVWQLATVVVGQDLLLVSPRAVVVRLGELATTADFWATVWHSVSRITAGFLAAAVVGALAAAAAAGSAVVDALLTPVVTAIRSTPVVSFIILVLMWTGSGRLALVISFTMVLPVFYANVLAGIRSRDRALLEMAAVFDVPTLRRVPAVDLPAVLPFVVAACRIGVGLAWKSGVAAEVIGLPQGSIGERLYQAKLFLSTADLFAWTVVVVALSYGLERLVLALLDRLRDRLAREAGPAGPAAPAAPVTPQVAA
ncbi:ABC transporter permease [Cellulomonas hominis]